jgi:tRNA-dihydrouridine synthase B
MQSQEQFLKNYKYPSRKKLCMYFLCRMCSLCVPGKGMEYDMIKALTLGTVCLPNNLLCAPMAGITDTVFRTLARAGGCSLCYTEMVSANGLTRGAHATARYLKHLPEDRPLGVQLFGAEPEMLADAAAIAVGRGADIIDVNMGCPVKKVVKAGAGAALLRSPRKVETILKSVRVAVAVPLTVKIRAGWTGDDINAMTIARIAEDSGADAVTIHPRTAAQGFRGNADWDLIGRVKAHVGIPVIGNGDIHTPEDALQMMIRTGCDGVMIGRAALGRPWLFQKIVEYATMGETTPDPTPVEREKAISRHLDMSMNWYGETQGVVRFRKHLLWYTRGLRGGARFRQAILAITDAEHLLEEMHVFLPPPEQISMP